jgi:hypothetical protein
MTDKSKSRKKAPKAKLKLARGHLLRQIRSGRMEPPPGYMGNKEIDQLPTYRAMAARWARHAKKSKVAAE